MGDRLSYFFVTLAERDLNRIPFAKVPFEGHGRARGDEFARSCEDSDVIGEEVRFIKEL